MTLLERVDVDLKGAVKARDAQRVSALRLLLAALKNEAIARGVPAVPDADARVVIEREAKKRREAADAYARAGRVAQTEQERREETLLRAYLPEPLPDAELEAEVRKALAALGEKPTVGVAMGMVMKSVRGRADGTRVRVVVERILGS